MYYVLQKDLEFLQISLGSLYAALKWLLQHHMGVQNYCSEGSCKSLCTPLCSLFSTF
jgi:hypothetical protein